MSQRDERPAAANAGSREAAMKQAGTAYQAVSKASALYEDFGTICCPEGAIGLSPGFQPWEALSKRICPEGARDHGATDGWHYACDLGSGIGFQPVFIRVTNDAFRCAHNLCTSPGFQPGNPFLKCTFTLQALLSFRRDSSETSIDLVHPGNLFPLSSAP
jgi:hypothetical protein